MFKQRLLTALVLVPLVLLILYFANPWFLGAVVLAFVIVGGWEWLALIPLHTVFHKLGFMLALVLMVGVSWYWFYPLLVVDMLLWGCILLAVLTYPVSQIVWGRQLIVGGVCLVLLPLFASTLAAIYQYPQGTHWVVYLLCLVWAADTGAYLAGKYAGRHKLIPRVSPGKTVEGVLGGFLLAMGVAYIASIGFKPSSLLHWYGMAAGTALISLLGDLFISMLKRRRRLKDTGNLFPGHGGVLDRIDSLLAALPLFYCGLTFFHQASGY